MFSMIWFDRGLLKNKERLDHHFVAVDNILYRNTIDIRMIIDGKRMCQWLWGYMQLYVDFNVAECQTTQA